MRKARLTKPTAQVGPKRLERLLASAELRKRMPLLIRQAEGRARRIKRLDATGLKRWYIPGREEERILTPYARIEKTRRRAKRQLTGR